jgi:hypothetical protein
MNAASLLFAFAALGHHSHPAFYDQCTALTIEGRIDSLQWKNPHALLDITADDGKAYRAEWNPPNALKREGIAEPTIGERVVIVGNPMRDVAAIRARFPSLTLEPPAKPVVDLISIRRTSDNWSWSRAEPASHPDCGRK